MHVNKMKKNTVISDNYMYNDNESAVNAHCWNIGILAVAVR